jgi:hypothetical protein
VSFSDRINPEDHTWMGLSQPPGLDHMPGVLLCPAGHRAYRHIVELADPERETIRSVFWGCNWCTIVYRYQECTLPPGEEGLPPEETVS